MGTSPTSSGEQLVSNMSPKVKSGKTKATGKKSIPNMVAKQGKAPKSKAKTGTAKDKGTKEKEKVTEVEVSESESSEGLNDPNDYLVSQDVASKMTKEELLKLLVNAGAVKAAKTKTVEGVEPTGADAKSGEVKSVKDSGMKSRFTELTEPADIEKQWVAFHKDVKQWLIVHRGTWDDKYLTAHLLSKIGERPRQMLHTILEGDMTLDKVMEALEQRYSVFGPAAKEQAIKEYEGLSRGNRELREFVFELDEKRQRALTHGMIEDAERAGNRMLIQCGLPQDQALIIRSNLDRDGVATNYQTVRREVAKIAELQQMTAKIATKGVFFGRKSKGKGKGKSSGQKGKGATKNNRVQTSDISKALRTEKHEKLLMTHKIAKLEKQAAAAAASVLYTGKGSSKGKGSKGKGKGGNVQPGDWTCPACGVNVFASKNACFKCGAVKPGQNAALLASGTSTIPCKYHAQGTCRYGTSCRFRH